MSQITLGVPPVAGTRLNWLFAKNATSSLDGDQNGSLAPVVPDSGWARAVSSARVDTVNGLRPGGHPSDFCEHE